VALRCGKFVVVSSSVGGVVQHVRSRCPCSGVWPLTSCPGKEYDIGPMFRYTLNKWQNCKVKLQLSVVKSYVLDRTPVKAGLFSKYCEKLMFNPCGQQDIAA